MFKPRSLNAGFGAHYHFGLPVRLMCDVTSECAS
jgi:hypothetical protein